MNAVRTVTVGDALLTLSITRRVVERFARPPVLVDSPADPLSH